ncbi:PREDICTED: pinin-like [Amphimedon queenslandica]|uniref:Pinin/SDK/MemA protein domain-containing protein n=1 Tax=Amphimedon queenslandica TaxID=400682 RepID=A0A1X7ULA2_AMPQE|nr:PREDICTED: pinin-like [Amphimedon queenslandica]|eukprot:XP_011404793.2 PREDICTED: pinin-like [Amphimedon queenslandica]
MSLGSVQILHKSLQEAKKNLEGTNHAILRISGRDPKSKDAFQSERRMSGGRPRPSWSDDNLPPTKRRISSSSFNKSGGDFEGDDDINKSETDSSVNLRSSVSTAPVPPRPTAPLNTDKTSRQRNRRMFGMLMGTLQKFQKDNSQDTEQEKRRVQIENKLEQVAMREREEATQQKKMLLDQRKLQRKLVGKLTYQLESVELYEDWNQHDMKLTGYIKTKAQPPLFYLPSEHNEATKTLLTESSNLIKETIKSREDEIKGLLQENESHNVAEDEQINNDIMVDDNCDVVDEIDVEH